MYENKRGADSREFSYQRDACGHRETRLISEMFLKRKNAKPQGIGQGENKEQRNEYLAHL